MIIHKLLLHHLSHRDDPGFYEVQAQDAVLWLKRVGVSLTSRTRALDLGCGHGILGNELARQGCDVWFADFENTLVVDTARARFLRINIDQEDLAKLGTYDLVICSNVYEHLAKPWQFLQNAPQILNPGGHLYLSWTNWLSPWGGHEFSPFHYLGSRRGHHVYDRLVGRPRIHTPFVDLYPTYIGQTLRHLRKESRLRILKIVPRYYPEFAWLTRIPVLREFLTWNCALLLQRIPQSSPDGA
jgi:SAM-dependent methyltransferase